LITGGTGSFGNAVLNLFLHTEVKEIRIFSRDELKPDYGDMNVSVKVVKIIESYTKIINRMVWMKN